MPRAHLSGPERLARLFCKVLLEQPVLTLSDFLNVITDQIAEDRS
jgi:hypothetical protein